MWICLFHSTIPSRSCAVHWQFLHHQLTPKWDFNLKLIEGQRPGLFGCDLQLLCSWRGRGGESLLNLSTKRLISSFCNHLEYVMVRLRSSGSWWWKTSRGESITLTSPMVNYAILMLVQWQYRHRTLERFLYSIILLWPLPWCTMPSSCLFNIVSGHHWVILTYKAFFPPHGRALLSRYLCLKLYVVPVPLIYTSR